MRTVVVTTCGTSLLTNRFPAPPEKTFVNQHTNLSRAAMDPENRSRLDGMIATATSELAAADGARAAAMSAELNSLQAVTGRVGDSGPQTLPPGTVDHLLIHTDTALGAALAAAVGDWIHARRGESVALLEPVGGLNTASLENLQAALPDLVRTLGPLIRDYREAGTRVVFNLTGGFKSVNGFLQALGMVMADECVYLFEGSSSLMRIPRLPLTLDVEGLVETHWALFRRLAGREAVSAAEVGVLPETLVLVVGESATLSAWGEVVWADAWPRICARRLMPPVEARHLVVAKAVFKAAEALNPGQLRTANERLMDLETFLAARSRGQDTAGANLASLDVKPLKGNPAPDRTHEFDLFHDNGAKRGYGHFRADGAFEVVAFDRHT